MKWREKHEKSAMVTSYGHNEMNDFFKLCFFFFFSFFFRKKSNKQKTKGRSTEVEEQK